MSLLNKLQKLETIPIDIFMQLCLTDKDFGYYTNNKTPIGRLGDFTTAPEVSQLFGEIIAFFLIEEYLKLKPEKLTIVELGGGRGTLLADIFRILTSFNKDFSKTQIVIVEVNPALKELQKQNISKYNQNITWIKSIDEAEFTTPTFFIANEFFDALPVKQFRVQNNKFFELILNFRNETIEHTLNPNFSLTAEVLAENIFPLKDEAIFEYSPLGNTCITTIKNVISKNGGLALIFDYGYLEPPLTSTIQSIKNHQKVTYLEDFGGRDISSLVNFPLLIKLIDPLSYDIMKQRDFLLKFGILERLNFLLNKATPKQTESLKTGVNRLIDEEEMGSLFKVLIIGNKQC